jgi:hypothetical protein
MRRRRNPRPITGWNNFNQDDANMKMTKMILVAAMAVLLLIGVSARAGVVTVTPDKNIPVGNPLGITSTITESGLASSPIKVTVGLDITGGYNGALYGYLSYDGMIVSLLNRPGVTSHNPLGALGSGLNVTLSDGAGYQNINTASETPGVQFGGGATYNAAGGSAAFGTAFNGTINPDGTWTLFLANLSSGSGQSELVSWSLGITAVPEPVDMALGIFAGLLVLGGLWRTERAQKIFHKITVR